MYTLEVETDFSAAHQLRGYAGKCENLHGHNWRVRLCVQGAELDEAGMLVDFAVLKSLLAESTAQLDHSFLNDAPPFDALNPTSENVARFLAEDVDKRLPGGVRVARLTVWESDRCSATYHAQT